MNSDDTGRYHTGINYPWRPFRPSGHKYKLKVKHSSTSVANKKVNYIHLFHVLGEVAGLSGFVPVELLLSDCCACWGVVCCDTIMGSTVGIYPDW